jgi:hypothetical protein
MFDGADLERQVVFVGPALWPTFAASVAPHFARMAEGSGGRFLATDIENSARAGSMQTWLMMEGPRIMAVIVTEVVQYPRLRALRGVGMVGSRPRSWTHLIARIEAAAKANFGCDIVEALHQPGHERLLTTGGWHPWHVLSEKRL